MGCVHLICSAFTQTYTAAAVNVHAVVFTCEGVDRTDELPKRLLTCAGFSVTGVLL